MAPNETLSMLSINYSELYILALGCLLTRKILSVKILIIMYLFWSPWDEPHRLLRDYNIWKFNVNQTNQLRFLLQ